jgi:GT2 family glycosyltransferase
MTEPGLVSAIVVAYESARDLEVCFEALARQTHRSVEALLADNGSRDGGPELVERRFPGVRVLRLGANLGYAAANDRALGEARGEHVLFLNPDCRLAPDYLERALARLAADPHAAAVQGKLLKCPRGSPSARAFRPSAPPRDPVAPASLREDASSEPGRIDSTGIVVTRSRRNFDRGEGEIDAGQFDRASEVFGVSGAAALYRRRALDDIAIAGEPFDASYWMYREDLDVCWRARLLGWRFLYEPAAVAWHARGFGRADRSRVPRALRHASLRNRYLTLLKNDELGALVRALPWLAVFELLQAGHVLLREPALLLAYLGVLRRLPDALRKRRAVQSRREVARGELERWFVSAREAGVVV